MVQPQKHLAPQNSQDQPIFLDLNNVAERDITSPPPQQEVKVPRGLTLE